MLVRMCVASRNPQISTRPMTSIRAVPMLAVTSWRRRSVPATLILTSCSRSFGQLEAHPGANPRYLDRAAIHHHGCVAPVFHRVDGGLIEHPWRRRFHHVHVARLSAGVDRVLEGDAAA